MLQTIPFTSDAENERKLLRELKVNVDAADCPYIVQFFGAFYIDVRHFWIIISNMHIYKAVHGLGSRYLRDELHSLAAVQARQRLRSSTRDDFVVIATNFKFCKKSFFFTAPRLWNCLPLTVRRKESTDSFKMALKTFLHSDADVLDT